MFGRKWRKWKRKYQEAQRDLSTLKLVMPVDKVNLAKSLDAERNYVVTLKEVIAKRDQRLAAVANYEETLESLTAEQDAERLVSDDLRKRLAEANDLRKGWEKSSNHFEQLTEDLRKRLAAAEHRRDDLNDHLTLAYEMEGQVRDETREKIKQLKAESAKLRAARWHKEAVEIWDLGERNRKLVIANRMVNRRLKKALAANGKPPRKPKRKRVPTILELARRSRVRA